MQDDSQAPVGQPTDSSGSTENQDKKDYVAYESHKKVLSEKKNYQAKLEEATKELETLRSEKLKLEGNKDELIKTWEVKAKENESRFNETRNKFAWKSLKSAVETEALKAGCKHPDKLIKLLDSDDLKSISVDEDFNVDSQTVKSVIEKSKSDNPFLFGKTATIADVTPQNDVKSKTKTESDLFSDYFKSKGWS